MVKVPMCGPAYGDIAACCRAVGLRTYRADCVSAGLRGGSGDPPRNLF